MNENPILITGGSGHLGTALVRRMKEGGCPVVLLGRSRGRFAKDLFAGDNVNFAPADIACRDQLIEVKKQFEDIRRIIHIAAFVPKNPDEGRNASLAMQVNALGTANLLEVFADQLEDLVYASTVEVYGPPIRVPIDEDHETNPQSYYGISKLSGEWLVKAFAREMGFRPVILRYASIFGPGERIARAIPHFIDVVAQGGQPVIRGDGEDLRDFLFLDDAVTATINALGAKAQGVYNIAGSHRIKIVELVRLIGEICGRDLEPEFQPSRNPGQDFIFDTARARQAFSWEARISLRDGLKRQIEAYLHERNHNGKRIPEE